MSDDNLSARVLLACAEADEILHRNGPASYIDISMKCAADDASYAHGCGYFGYVRDDLKEIEREATKAGMSKDVVEALVRGYEGIIDACHRKYKEGNGQGYLKFANECKKRIVELLPIKNTKQRRASCMPN